MDNIKVDLKETEWEVVDWITGSRQGPVMDSCEQSNEPLGCIKEGNVTSWVTPSFSRRALIHGVLVIKNVIHRSYIYYKECTMCNRFHDCIY
jgi:hypothetical protein